MCIEQSRCERADDVTANLKRLMDRRRLMHRASDRLEILRVKSEGIKITIPADGIEGMMGQCNARETHAGLYQNIHMLLFIDRNQLSRRIEIALRVRCSHRNLPLVVQVP